MTDKKIAIVGGGLSGLLLAYKLSKANYQVTIFEKEQFLGGDLASIGSNKGWPVDRFYHHLFINSPNAKELYKELGMEQDLVTHESKMGLWKEEFFPFNKPKDIINIPFLSYISKIKLGISSLFLPHIPFKLFENFTAEKVIKFTMSKEIWDKFWGPIFNLKFDSFSSKVSGAWFWARLKDRTSTRSGGEKLIYPNGGFQGLLFALEKKLKNQKVKVTTKKLITKIVQKQKGFLVDGKFFDLVICAVPVPVFLKIAPITIKEKESLSQIKYLSNVTMSLWTKEKVTDYYWTNILDQNISFGVVVEHTNLISQKKYGSNLLYLGRYYDPKSEFGKLSDQEIAKVFLKDIEILIPSFEKKIKNWQIYRSDFAQPVIEKGYKKPEFKSSVSGLFHISAAHIYPQDRGIENVIRQVNYLVDIINS